MLYRLPEDDPGGHSAAMVAVMWEDCNNPEGVSSAVRCPTQNPSIQHYHLLLRQFPSYPICQLEMSMHMVSVQPSVRGCEIWEDVPGG